MPQAIILAAGTASRAQVNKLLLRYQNRFLIEHAISGLQSFVQQIFVVTGHYHDELSSVLTNIKGITIIRNTQYEKGMFSSIKAALPYLSDDFFVLPGDCPFVSNLTYEQILDSGGMLRVPTYKGIKGHPLFVKKDLLPILKAEPEDSTLKSFRDRIGFTMIPVLDPNILIDIDTMADFTALPK